MRTFSLCLLPLLAALAQTAGAADEPCGGPGDGESALTLPAAAGGFEAPRATPTLSAQSDPRRNDPVAALSRSDGFKALSAGDFDGNRRPLAVDLSWGSAPRSEAYARDMSTLYGLYGRGTDELLGLALPDKTGAGAVAARAAKAPVDAALAWYSMVAQHETGHRERALMGGAGAASVALHWDGSGVTQVTKGWDNMDPSARQAFDAGGVDATQAAAAELRRMILSEDRVDWTLLPQVFMAKYDISHYGLTSPRASRAGPADAGDDMVGYAEDYGWRSGKNPDAISRAIVRGALWNALDPINIWALYGYVGRYVLRGEESLKNPMVEVAGVQIAAGTGFWLSEVGPQYELPVTLRARASGAMLEFDPSLGDDGQAAFGARAWSPKLGGRTRVSAGFRGWSQRAGAEPGPKRLGGAAQAGISVDLTKRLGASVELGYKSPGAMLGQDQSRTPFAIAGMSARF